MELIDALKGAKALIPEGDVSVALDGFIQAEQGKIDAAKVEAEKAKQTALETLEAHFSGLGAELESAWSHIRSYL